MSDRVDGSESRIGEKAHSGHTGQQAQQSPQAQQSSSVDNSSRYVQKTQDYLENALKEESKTDKNYHIRHALQLLQLEQSKGQR